MEHITSLSGGANYHVLRSFYVHAIRPIIEYSSPALANLTDTQIRSLEVAQNNALRLILGAPMWTRLCNLQMECNIPPLYSRITALNARVIARALSQPRDAPFVNRVKIELCRNPNFPIPNTWLAGMGRAARKCNLCEELLSRKPNSLNELYRGRAPWEEFPATFNFTELPNSKANCTEQQLKGAAEEAMRKVYTEGCTEYFTDGSVDNSIPATGARVFSTHFTGSWRLSNTCSTLQTELIAILKALEYSLNNGNGTVVIHTDSKSALQAIQKEDMKENSLLMSSIVACLELHKVRNGPVCLNWIPSHIGIPGNESADRLANESLRTDTIAIKVQLSLGQVKVMAKEYEKKSLIENHQMWTDNNARFATWYRQATHMNPHPIAQSTTRNLQTIIHRLRLGYRCTWEIVNQEERVQLL